MREILKRFKMDQCKLVLVPLEQKAKLYSDDGTREADVTLYRYLVGSMNYLTTMRYNEAK